MPCAGEDGSPGLKVESNPAHEEQNKYDNKNDTDDAHAPVTVAKAVATKPATEAAKQKYNQDDDEYDSKRHGPTPVMAADREVRGFNCTQINPSGATTKPNLDSRRSRSRARRL